MLIQIATSCTLYFSSHMYCFFYHCNIECTNYASLVSFKLELQNIIYKSWILPYTSFWLNNRHFRRRYRPWKWPLSVHISPIKWIWKKVTKSLKLITNYLPFTVCPYRKINNMAAKQLLWIFRYLSPNKEKTRE